MVTDAWKRPLWPLVNRSPARRSSIAQVRRNVDRLRSRTETVSVAHDEPEQAFRSSFTTVLSRDPTSIEAAETLPALRSGVLPRDRFLKRGTVEFRLRVPSRSATLPHSLHLSGCEYILAETPGGFDWDEAARNTGAFCEAERCSVTADICREPG